MKLQYHDLQFALLRTPRVLLAVMKAGDWHGKIYVGGGFLRSTVAGDHVNDVDVFVQSKKDADRLAKLLVINRMRLGKAIEELTVDEAEQVDRRIYKTDNALTLTCFTPAIQIIHRWTFETGASVADSFDFSCCAAAFWFDEGWSSYCHDRFYPDIASKRLVYLNPERNEDAGGSMLRVLKYYQKGYRIPLDSLAQVITRLFRGVELEKVCFLKGAVGGKIKPNEEKLAKVICGLLREVDPNVDPNHIAHLPAETGEENLPLESLPNE
jgi:hypothetical protein